MSQKLYRVKKLFNGCASIRDFIVMKCLDEHQDIVVQYGDKKMTLDQERLKNMFQMHSTKFKSKYNGEEYSLYDIRFIEDGTKEEPVEETPVTKESQLDMF